MRFSTPFFLYLLPAPDVFAAALGSRDGAGSVRTKLLEFYNCTRGFVAAAKDDIGIRRRSTTFGTSEDGVDSAGFYYSLYNPNEAGAGYTEFDSTGEFQIGWNTFDNNTEFLGGKGFKDSNTRTLTWDGYFTATGDYTLAIYGWTLDPVTEWYIVEAHGTGTPGNGNVIGTIDSDDGTYDVFDLYYTDVTPIYGVNSFHQYWSVRQVNRTVGSVDVSVHFDGWKQLGLAPGTPIFQMVTLEGFSGQGYLDFTVSP